MLPEIIWDVQTGSFLHHTNFPVISLDYFPMSRSSAESEKSRSQWRLTPKWYGTIQLHRFCMNSVDMYKTQ